MLVYDITNEKSFDNIKNWIRNIEEVCIKWQLKMLRACINIGCHLVLPFRAFQSNRQGYPRVSGIFAHL